MSVLWTLLILILLSFLPAMGYLAWVRKSERYHEEGWRPLLKAFLFGAVISTIVSAILEGVFYAAFSQVLQPDIGAIPKSSTTAYLFLAIMAAPFIEEGMKAVGVYGTREHLRYLADGMVFGASVGFGFGFIENTLYGLSTFQEYGFAVAITTLLVRSISSILLHGSATAMTGYGVAENSLHSGRGHMLVGYYLLAVLMHASFNALLSLPLLLPAAWTDVIGTDILTFLTLVVAIAYAIYAFGHIRNRISELQFKAINRINLPGAWRSQK